MQLVQQLCLSNIQYELLFKFKYFMFVIAKHYLAPKLT